MNSENKALDAVGVVLTAIVSIVGLSFLASKAFAPIPRR